MTIFTLTQSNVNLNVYFVEFCIERCAKIIIVSLSYLLDGNVNYRSILCIKWRDDTPVHILQMTFILQIYPTDVLMYINIKLMDASTVCRRFAFIYVFINTKYRNISLSMQLCNIYSYYTHRIYILGRLFKILATIKT